MNACDNPFSENGLRSSRRQFIFDWFRVMATAGLIVWLVYASGAGLGYNWQWYRVPRYLYTFSEGHFLAGPLLEGLVVTLKVSAVSLVLSSMFGLITAICRLSGSFTARAIARAYLELIRNTPLLVQLFFIYFVFSPMVDLSRFASAVLALSLFEGAYASEIFAPASWPSLKDSGKPPAASAWAATEPTGMWCCPRPFARWHHR
jgi:polar amino acid transport system permease protein